MGIYHYLIISVRSVFKNLFSCFIIVSCKWERSYSWSCCPHYKDFDSHQQHLKKHPKMGYAGLGQKFFQSNFWQFSRLDIHAWITNNTRVHLYRLIWNRNVWMNSFVSQKTPVSLFSSSICSSFTSKIISSSKSLRTFSFSVNAIRYVFNWLAVFGSYPLSNPRIFLSVEVV